MNVKDKESKNVFYQSCLDWKTRVTTCHVMSGMRASGMKAMIILSMTPCSWCHVRFPDIYVSCHATLSCWRSLKQYHPSSDTSFASPSQRFSWEENTWDQTPSRQLLPHKMNYHTTQRHQIAILSWKSELHITSLI